MKTVPIRLAALVCLAFVAGCANTVSCTCALAESGGEEFEEGLAPGEDGTCESRAEQQPAYLYCFDANAGEGAASIMGPSGRAALPLLDSALTLSSWPPVPAR